MNSNLISMSHRLVAPSGTSHSQLRCPERARSAGWSATTVADPGATSVNPPSVTTGSPLASSSFHCPTPAVRTAKVKFNFLPFRTGRRCQFPPGQLHPVADLRHGLPGRHRQLRIQPEHRHPVPARRPAAADPRSRSRRPGAWPDRRASRPPAPAGTPGPRPTRAPTVIPGSARARSQAAPRARRTTFRIRASSQARGRRGPSPRPPRSPEGRTGTRSTARAAPSSASVRAGGAARSTRTTSGSAYCGPSSRTAACIAAGARCPRDRDPGPGVSSITC